LFVYLLNLIKNEEDASTCHFACLSDRHCLWMALERRGSERKEGKIKSKEIQRLRLWTSRTRRTRAN